MRLVGVAQDKIEQLWPHVKNHVKRACRYSYGRYAPEDIKKSLLERDRQLWVIWDKSIEAVCITQIVIYPTLKACQVFLVSGKNRGEWLDLANGEIAQWAKAQGCQKVESLGRPGWEADARRRGWKKTHVIFERTL